MSRNSLSTDDLKKLPSWVHEIPEGNDIPLMRHCSEDSFSSSNESSCSLTLDKSSSHSQDKQNCNIDWCHNGGRSDISNASSSDSINSIIENLPLHEVPEMEESENDSKSSAGSAGAAAYISPSFRKRVANKEDFLRRWYDSSDVCLPTWVESDCSSSDDSPPTSGNSALHQIQEEVLVEEETRTPHKVFHANPQRQRSTFSVTVLIFCAISFTYYYFSRCTLAENLKNSRDLLAYTQKLGLQLKIAQKDVTLMELELAALDELESSGLQAPSSEALTKALADPERMKEMITVQRSLKRSQYEAEHLKETVKETSKADAIATYGAATRRVRIELAFPDDEAFGGHGVGSSHANVKPTVFVIEMAPIDLMPHSVYTFLEMVSAGLLDGCSFILNAMHVLKAAPLPYDGTPPSVKAQEFLDKGLESVAFREYSADYPHKQYTVGFAADGSPSFYINTEDNSEIHAGDPCFAKVVSGFETIHRLEDSPTRNGLWLVQRVGIKSVTVL